jgi:hypothetical protein
MWKKELPYRNKSRHGVLGFWHEIKLGIWKEHLEICEQSNEEVPF